MVMCWHRNPRARPTFIEIIETLLKDASPKFRQVSYYHTQHLTSTGDTDDASTPTTPLRSPGHDLDDSDLNAYRYFPSAMFLPDDDSHHEHNNLDVIASSSNCEPEITNSNEGSKGVSINYSDGSKGSKISTFSNGSIANGHINVNLERTTQC